MKESERDKKQKSTLFWKTREDGRKEERKRGREGGREGGRKEGRKEGRCAKWIKNEIGKSVITMKKIVQ